MNLLFTFPLLSDYYNFIPDFGFLNFLVYARNSDVDIENARQCWDGFWIVMLPFLLVLSYRFSKKLVICLKKQKVNKRVQSFAKKDPFWNINAMRKIARSLFYEVQSAWFNNNFKPLAPMLIDNIKFEWQETWKIMQKNNYKFLVGKIDIRNVNIISVEDHFDDNRDKFKVEISGYIKRYVKNKPNDAWFSRSPSDYEEFTDIYSFVRNDDEWLLDDIHHDAKFTEIMSFRSKNYHMD